MGDSSETVMTVVAVGPGDPEMLTMRGRKAIESADLVVGFKTVLDVIAPLVDKGELRAMSYRDQEEVFDYAQQQVKQGRSCVVCCWGDLNVSAKELLERVSRRVDRVELIPGVSSIQIACARAGIYLEESLFITLHRRSEEATDLSELVYHLNEGRRHIILLPRPFDLMPPTITRRLVESGISPERKLTVYQRLTFADEQQWTGGIAECADLPDEFSDLSIMVFLRPEQQPD